MWLQVVAKERFGGENLRQPSWLEGGCSCLEGSATQSTRQSPSHQKAGDEPRRRRAVCVCAVRMPPLLSAISLLLSVLLFLSNQVRLGPSRLGRRPRLEVVRMLPFSYLKPLIVTSSHIHISPSSESLLLHCTCRFASVP